MRISIYNAQKDVPVPVRFYRQAICFLLSLLEIDTDEVVVHFVTKKKITHLHQRFFNDPTATDCITFPVDALSQGGLGYRVLGEIVVCAKVAEQYAKQHAIHVQEELMRYVIHGLLHLIGYSDIDVSDRCKMKRKERHYLQKLFRQKFWNDKFHL